MSLLKNVCCLNLDYVCPDDKSIKMWNFGLMQLDLEFLLPLLRILILKTGYATMKVAIVAENWFQAYRFWKNIFPPKSGKWNLFGGRNSSVRFIESWQKVKSIWLATCDPFFFSPKAEVNLRFLPAYGQRFNPQRVQRCWQHLLACGILFLIFPGLFCF